MGLHPSRFGSIEMMLDGVRVGDSNNAEAALLPVSPLHHSSESRREKAQELRRCLGAIDGSYSESSLESVSVRTNEDSGVES